MLRLPPAAASFVARLPPGARWTLERTGPSSTHCQSGDNVRSHITSRTRARHARAIVMAGCGQACHSPGKKCRGVAAHGYAMESVLPRPEGQLGPILVTARLFNLCGPGLKLPFIHGCNYRAASTVRC